MWDVEWVMVDGRCQMGDGQGICSAGRFAWLAVELGSVAGRLRFARTLLSALALALALA
jgi:hypothetical protein